MPPRKRVRQRREKGSGGLHQRADGMWIAQVWREDGTRYQRGRKRYDEALAELRKMTEEVRDGIDPRQGTMTVQNWLEHWTDSIAAKRVKPGTLDTYRSSIKRQIIPEVGDKQLARLKPADIRRMVDKITTRRTTRTAQIAYNILSKSLTDAVNEGLIRQNPCDRMDRPESRSEERQPLTVDQARTVLLHVAQSADPATCARWTLALLSGVRQGEALGLTWDRIDFTHDEFDISWQLRRVRLKPGVPRPEGEVYPREVFAAPATFDFEPVWRGMCLVSPKTKGSRRVIPMLAPLRAALLAHRDSGSGGRLVFTRTDGTPVVAADDTAEWRAVCVASGIVEKAEDAPDQHASRNTVATLLMEAGVEESVRMQILGHTTVTAHRGYVSTSTDVTRAALTKMADMLKLDAPAAQPPVQT